MSRKKLAEYEERRDFRSTSEPRGEGEAVKGSQRRFVIQKHDASSGHYDFRLEVDGEKIRGGYALQRIGSGDDERWLLVKMDDEEADARRNPISTEPESVLSGRTIEEVARATDAPTPDEE